jgi:hypothetical protein
MSTERDRARWRAASKRRREEHPDANREWREANPERSKELRRDYQQRIYAIIKEAKTGKACTACGRNDLPPWALELHHVRGRKRFNIGRWYEASKWRPKRRKGESVADAIRTEIAKCDVVCPTCHRLHHPPPNV